MVKVKGWSRFEKLLKKSSEIEKVAILTQTVRLGMVDLRIGVVAILVSDTYRFQFWWTPKHQDSEL